MNVQTDRNNWSVPDPQELDYAISLSVAALGLILTAIYYSGVAATHLAANSVRLFSAVLKAAHQRGEGRFWLGSRFFGCTEVMLFTAT